MSPVSASVVIGVLVLVLVVVGVAWRARGRAQSHLALPPLPADVGEERGRIEGMHVATTFAGRPLERVFAGGLGFRARSVLTLTDRGLVLDRAGAPSVLLPPGAVTVGTATWALDRGVERDGLVVLSWSLLDDRGAAVPVESAFRLTPTDQAALLAALPRTEEAPVADQPH